MNSSAISLRNDVSLSLGDKRKKMYYIVMTTIAISILQSVKYIFLPKDDIGTHRVCSEMSPLFVLCLTR